MREYYHAGLLINLKLDFVQLFSTFPIRHNRVFREGNPWVGHQYLFG